jgi:hypothetical protein
MLLKAVVFILIKALINVDFPVLLCPVIRVNPLPALLLGIPKFIVWVVSLNPKKFVIERLWIKFFKLYVYEGLDVEAFTQEDIKYAQLHLRIISGLYGLLRPLDLIQPYRLEMGTKLLSQNYKNLYEYWGDKIIVKLNELLKSGESDLLVNLASAEYFKVINQKLFNRRLITPVFKERKNSEYKVIPIFAKKARGLMTSYIIKQRIESIDDIKHFNGGGYEFNAALSTETELVFTR